MIGPGQSGSQLASDFEEAVKSLHLGAPEAPPDASVTR
jgi:hypothetical protein